MSEMNDASKIFPVPRGGKCSANITVGDDPVMIKGFNIPPCVQFKLEMRAPEHCDDIWGPYMHCGCPVFLSDTNLIEVIVPNGQYRLVACSLIPDVPLPDLSEVCVYKQTYISNLPPKNWSC